MAASVRWDPGTQIALNSVWDGKLRASWPVRVISDTPALLVAYLAPGTSFKRMATPNGQLVRMPIGDGHFTEVIWTAPTITFAFPNRPYRLLAFQAEPTGSIVRWYANLETPFVRTPDGYEFTDLFLDVVFNSDFSQWQWKDEGGLREAVEAELLSSEEATKVYEAGKQVIAFTKDQGQELLKEWGGWRPDPTWRVPILG
ncbi:MAG: DUF402 domain-containing protein [Chloroflexi bacterium]|nr:DUF402 domain-containing protein [Chloroflexota bacterium]